MKRFIDTWKADGGGDEPECIADGLHAASKLDWRSDATKLLLLCSDAPPHGVGCSGDNHPKGCPLDLDPLKIARDMVQKEIIIYTVGVNSPGRQTVSFLCTLAKISGGRYLPLAEADDLPKILMGGAEEELELAKFEKQMEEAEQHIVEEAKQNKEELTDDQISARVASKMAGENVKLKKLKVATRGGGSSWKAQEEVMAKCDSLSSYARVEQDIDFSDAPAYAGASAPARGYGSYADDADDAPPAPGIFSRLSSAFSKSASSFSMKQEVVEEEDFISTEQVHRMRTKKK